MKYLAFYDELIGHRSQRKGMPMVTVLSAAVNPRPMTLKGIPTAMREVMWTELARRMLKLSSGAHTIIHTSQGSTAPPNDVIVPSWLEEHTSAKNSRQSYVDSVITRTKLQLMSSLPRGEIKHAFPRYGWAKIHLSTGE